MSTNNPVVGSVVQLTKSSPDYSAGAFAKALGPVITEIVRKDITDLQNKLEQITTERDTMRNQSTREKDERDALRRVVEAAQVLIGISLGESIGDAYDALYKLADALEKAKTQGYVR
jgi:hypothetical protein